jgi:hypothetical protein
MKNTPSLFLLSPFALSCLKRIRDVLRGFSRGLSGVRMRRESGGIKPMDLLKEWDAIDCLDEEKQLPFFLDALRAFSSPLPLCSRQDSLLSKEDLLRELQAIGSLKGALNSQTSLYLKKAVALLDLPLKDPAGFDQEILRKIRHTRKAVDPLVYEGFLEALWLLEYQALPLTEEGYQAIRSLSDVAQDNYPETLRDALRDEGR